ncbi:MAG: 2-amino-4-hydroxy-6-hydroxymethyldihydropteridine diphosphokinase [Pseudomonadota bacterium]
MADETKAYIGLGGNVGDVAQHMREAIQILSKNDAIELVSVSSVYKTPPWGITDQDWFLNACVGVSTTLNPRQLLEACQSIEKELKRERDIRWGPRTIDLDILIYGGLEIKEEGLEIPHPRTSERAFVLKPLADIAPEIVLDGKKVLQWLNEVDQSEIQLVEIELT